MLTCCKKKNSMSSKRQSCYDIKQRLNTYSCVVARKYLKTVCQSILVALGQTWKHQAVSNNIQDTRTFVNSLKTEHWSWDIKMSLTINAETKIDSEPCVVAWDNKLFVGTDSGAILSYDSNLSPGSTWTAHDVQLFALSAKDGKVYSASNDGGIRTWTSEGEKITLLPAPDADIESICIDDKYVYAGDEVGNVYVYENNDLFARHHVLEEVKGIAMSKPLMFTARDLYVTVTEIKPEDTKNRFVTRFVMEGRAPILVSESHLVVTSRGGNNIQLRNLDLGTQFQKLHEVKVSDMIITSLSVSDDIVWSGGWDGCARRWKIEGNKLQPAGEINLGACINALVTNNRDNAYAVLTGGKIVNIKAI